LIGTIFGGELT